MHASEPTSPHLHIEQVVVPQSSWPDELPRSVSNFVREALGPAEYVFAELPKEALIAHYLFLYYAEVRGGGHATFVGNVGSDAKVWSLIQEGLSLLQLSDAALIFADLQAFSAKYPERLAPCGDGYDNIDPYFWEIEDRYDALPQNYIADAITMWLKTRSWITVVTDEAYRKLIGRLVPDHPLLEARRELRRPEIEAEFWSLFAQVKKIKPH